MCVIYKDRDGGGRGSWCTVHSRHRLVGSSSVASVDRPELKDQKKKKKRKVNTAGVCFLLERCVSARLRQLLTRLSQSCCCWSLSVVRCTLLSHHSDVAVLGHYALTFPYHLALIGERTWNQVLLLVTKIKRHSHVI